MDKMFLVLVFSSFMLLVESCELCEWTEWNKAEECGPYKGSVYMKMKREPCCKGQIGLEECLFTCNVKLEDCFKYDLCVPHPPRNVDDKFTLDRHKRSTAKKCVPVDIMMVLDESGSIGFTDYQKMLQFSKDLVNDFTIGPDNAQVGFITYSNNPRSLFNFNTYSNKNDIINAINNVGYVGKGTYTAEALAYARGRIAPYYGKRSNALSLAIVLTDGVSNDPTQTINEATNLHNAGVTVFCIAIGSNVDTDELKAIASNPNDKYLIYSSDFDELQNKISQLVGSLCINDVPPTFETCMMEIQDDNGEKAQSHHIGTSTCQNQQDFYGKYQVSHAHTILKIASDGSLQSAPDSAEDFKYGITDASVQLIKKSMNDAVLVLKTSVVRSDPTTSTAPPSTLDAEVNISNSHVVVNGDRLCLRYYASAGGYVQYTGKRYVYTKTDKVRDLCYFFDSVAPKHCKDVTACATEPLSLSTQVTRKRHITANFQNWLDPFPTGYSSVFASGIKSYEIYMYEMKESVPGRLNMDTNPKLEIKCTTCTTMAVNLPASLTSVFYAVVLEVVDVALNHRQARRFVLFDDTSKIIVHDKKKITPMSASSNTNFLWQTNHGNLCYSWKDRYYNDEFVHFNPLNPIDQDHHGHITGVYEETTDGKFPVAGTKNVHGITSFRYTLKRDNSVLLFNQSVADVTSESVCIDSSTTLSADGQVFLLYLYAYDISLNSYVENITVNFDASPAEIKDIWLTKNGHKQLFVHDTSDLSLMQLVFRALDVHSGLHSVEWFIGTADDGKQIGHGAVGILRLSDKESCPLSTTSCYCPSVGVCQFDNFTLSLQSMIANNTHFGNHNRKYFFEIKVTNVAKLVKTERVEVLVDDSPPEAGVVQEGPPAGRDIDYTEDSNILISWTGFIDHESGIKFYEIGISNSCLTLNNFSSAEYQMQKNGHESETRFNILKAGKYYVTVIAYNNAVEPSTPVCSDGITIDESPPEISNIIMQNAKIPKSYYCFKNEMWYVDENVKKIKMDQSHPCYHSCSGYASKNMLQYIPELSENYTLPNLTCAITRNDNETYIYIPNDRITLSWNVTDEESQIDEVFVGFGSDKQMENNPDLEGYERAEHYTHYRKHHSGFNTGFPLFIFIKVRNKAGSQIIVTYGPVIIDESSPTCSKKPDVFVSGKSVSLNWDASSFFDNEQREDIGYIYYRIGHGHEYVTPFALWDIATPSDCSPHGHCITYPVKDLQRFEVESDLRFHFNLHVYNYGGHYCIINSSEIDLPSRYPSSNGSVFEIKNKDATNLIRYQEIDYVSTSGKVCVHWTGFEHREDCRYEVGIGTSNLLPDHLPFGNVNGSTYCYNANAFKPYVKYFSIVKASNSAGSSTVSSDGFVTVEESDFLDEIKVFDGPGCSNTREDASRSLNLAVIAGSEHELDWQTNLHIGEFYTLKIMSNSTDFEIKSDAIYKQNETRLGNEYTITFMTTTHTPSLVVHSVSSDIFIDTITLKRCLEDLDEMFVLEKVQAHWTLNKSLSEFVSYYEVSLIQNCQGTSCLRTILPFTSVGKRSHTTLNLLSLEEGSYTFLVRPCFSSFCFNSVASDSFIFETSKPNTGSVSAVLDIAEGTCDTLEVVFDAFECPAASQRPIFYRWSAVESKSLKKVLTNHFIINSALGTVIEDTRCIDLPVYPHSQLEVCIEGYCSSGKSVMVCAPLKVKQHPNTFSKDILYDLDENTALMLSIEKYKFSLNIGDKLTDLNDQEMDFHKSRVTPCGFISGTGIQELNWYLMKRANIPTGHCDDDIDCVQFKDSGGGFVVFKRVTLTEDTIYYICASSKTTQVGQANINMCSDGFLIDDTIPAAGSIEIETKYPGYIRSNKDITVKWSGFTDSAKYIELGYQSGIANYSVAVGSYPGGEDVLRYRSVGISEAAILTNLSIENGYTYFVSVQAIDHNGNSIVATSEGHVCDVTPPEVGDIFVGSFHSHQFICNTNVLSIHLRDFADKESGINKTEVGIGSTPTSADIVPFTVTDGRLVEISQTSQFYDGHKYYALTLVTNNIGLTSEAVSKVFVFDRTKPTGGVLRDGPAKNMRDVNYQTNITHLECHWTGFTDPHSGIKYFRVGFGLDPYDTGERDLVNVGLRTDWLWRHHMIPGVKYYTTVEACNGADLCTKVTSNGIISDVSPPIPGLVRVGLTGSHSKFSAHRSYLEAEWFGFEDPESGIGSYEACIGLSPGVCDVTKFKYCSKKLMTTFTGLNLPTATNLFLTVRATNNAGLSTTLSSDNFRVDDSPPEIISAPWFNVSGLSKYDDTQWDMSLIRINWHFDDNESPVLEHFVTFKSHHSGHIDIENIKLTSERNLTIPLKNDNWLRPGDTYYVTVTACNAAGLCKSATSNGLLIDSTSPHLGGFMPQMEWSNDLMSVNITWYGFTDVESKVISYRISVGSSYSGTELTGEVVDISHVGDEDDVQLAVLNISRQLVPGEKLFLSASAENGVGLISKAIVSSVEVVSTNVAHTVGNLLMEKHSCDVEYCNSDCTCSVLGSKCVDVVHNMTCTDIQLTSSTNNLVKLNMGLGDEHEQYSATTACLAANWDINNSTYESQIMRYEWSFGMENMPAGSGIFNSNEPVWYDIRKDKRVIHCLTRDRYLLHDHRYVAYLKVWLSRTSYSVYTSASTLIDTSSPVVNRGKYIMDSNGACNKDLEFINSSNNIVACWNGVFSDHQSGIMGYRIFIGTYPGGDDIVDVTDVGLQTSHNFIGLLLPAGTKYYVTVEAENFVGLRTVYSSDGFTVDNGKPSGGIVYNTDSFHDMEWRANATVCGASWNGFTDRHSYIKSYSVALADLDEVNQGNPITFQDAKLHNSFVFEGLNLQPQKSYVIVVKTTDAAGLESDIVLSAPFSIDLYPPVGFLCTAFEETKNETVQVNESSTSWVVAAELVRSDYYKLEIQFRNVSLESIVSITIGQISQILPVKIISEAVFTSEFRFFSFSDGLESISITGVIADSGIIDVTLWKCISSGQTSINVFNIQQIGPSRISASLHVLDNGSGIKDALIGAGTTEHGFQIQSLRPIQSDHFTIKADVPHGAPVYVKALVENHAGLRSKFVAQSILMDHTGPDISSVSASAQYKEEHGTHLTSVHMTWATEDKESGIKMCKCAFGTAERSDNLQQWTPAQTLSSCMLSLMHVEHGTSIYPSIRCLNSIDIVRQVEADRIVVSYRPPDESGSALYFTANSVNLDPTTQVQKYRSSLHFFWDNFRDTSSISNYQCRIISDNSVVMNWRDVDEHNYLSVNDIKLTDGKVYVAEVKAENVGNMWSKEVNASVTIEDVVPVLTGNFCQILNTTEQDKINLSWEDVFKLEDHLQPKFLLNIGSIEGHSDIVRSMHTTNKEFKITKKNAVTDLFVVITAKYITGSQTVYREKIPVV